MIIGIDWNCTLQDTINEIIRTVYLIYGVVLKPEDFNRWDPPIGQKLGIDNDVFTAWAWKSEGIQKRARAYPFAREVIRLLYTSGHTIKIITSTSCPHLVEAWLYRFKIPYHGLVVTQDKSSVEFDLLIDDNPYTCEKLFLEQRGIIRYAGVPWNRHLTHIPAADGWSLEMLSLILNHAQAAALNPITNGADL